MTSRRMMLKKICTWLAPSILRRLVQRLRDRVEEAVHQVGVHAERAAQVDHDQAELGAQTERRDDVGDAAEQQEDRDDGQQLREHLQQQQRQQAHAAAVEAHAGERVGGQRAQEHSGGGGDHADDQGVDEPAAERALPGR